jgi:hypothetical protein
LVTAYPTDAIKEGTEVWPSWSVLYDREGRTLTVWFSDPHEEHVCEETGDEVVLMKDSSGGVIGFEKLNIFHSRHRPAARRPRDDAGLSRSGER